MQLVCMHPASWMVRGLGDSDARSRRRSPCGLLGEDQLGLGLGLGLLLGEDQLGSVEPERQEDGSVISIVLFATTIRDSGISPKHSTFLLFKSQEIIKLLPETFASYLTLHT